MLNLAFLGDISLNDNYIDLYNKGVNPFKNIEPILENNDLVIGNLECLTKGEEGENALKKPRLTTTLETLNYLNHIHLNIACLAQNHIYDHLEDGFIRTVSFLDENKIMHLGAGLTRDKATRPVILEKDNIKVAILNYVTKDTNPNLPENAKVFLNMFEMEKCKRDIGKIRSEVNHIVLSLHWGGRVEGGLYPDWDQPRQAHDLIDAGADLIVGHHSHTIQPFEIYKGKYIFYSLGNFCFSDYYFNNEWNVLPKRRMVSMIVVAAFEQSGYKIKMSFFQNNLTSYSELNNYEQVLKKRNLVFNVISANKLIWRAYFFHLKFILPLTQFYSRKDLTFKTKVKRTLKYMKKKLF